jgi:exonuclease III
LKEYKKFAPPNSYLWFGDLPFKGIGIFSYGNYQFELLDGYDDSLKYCIPIRVTGKNNFNLIAVWAGPGPDRQLRYVRQIYKAVEQYIDFIRENQTVIIGDFNANKIFDPKNEEGNYSSLISKLAAEGLISSYHDYYGEEHGCESRNTFYLYRKADRPFHIDYCFIPRQWQENLRQVSVGSFEEWIGQSDHCPIMVELG